MVLETDRANQIFFDGVYWDEFALTANAVNDTRFTETMNIFWLNTNATHKLPLAHQTGPPHKFGRASVELEAGRFFYFYSLLLFAFVLVRNRLNPTKNEQKTGFRVWRQNFVPSQIFQWALDAIQFVGNDHLFAWSWADYFLRIKV